MRHLRTGSFEKFLVENLSALSKLAAFLFVLGLFLEGYFIFYPTFKLVQQERELKEEQNLLELKKKRLLVFAQRIANDKDYLQIEKALIGIDDPVPFLEQIESLALETGVLLEVKNITRQKEAGSLQYLVFSVEVKGEGDKVRSFVRRLESLPFFIKLGDVKWQLDKESGLSAISFQITGLKKVKISLMSDNSREPQ